MNKETKPPSRADTLVAARQTEQGKDTESDMGRGPQRCTWWGHQAGWGQREWEGLLETEGEAGGLETLAATHPEHWDSGRDEAVRGLKKSYERSSSCCDECGSSSGVESSPAGRGGQMQGPVRRPWQRESSLGLRRAWTRALGGKGLGQGRIWIKTHGQVGWKVYVGEGPVDLRPRPCHPFLGLSVSEPRLMHKAN